jgi:two-component system chemotaxis sensor kinase CheA
LLELNESRGDQELVGRVFRGLHTIKGSGAMFGFEKLAAFTHNLENAYDEVRNGRLEVSSELVDLTLSALDQIRAMLEEQADAVDVAACARILAKVGALTGIAEHRPAPKAASGSPIAANGPVRSWYIRFAPGPELLLNGSSPLLLFQELRLLGGLSVKPSMAMLPPLAELEPERCYLSWELMLIAAVDRDTIRDVFIFVEDSCELTIEPADQETDEESGSAAGVTDQRLVGAVKEPRSPTGGRRTYDKPENATSLRVPAAKLDQLVDLVGELVTVQARLSELATRLDDAEVAAVSEEIERLTSSLRQNSMNVRMLPIRATFEKFRRLVHDLARDLGKDVELTMEGADTELDKTVIDQLGDPLMHLIRNSMDHGIEPPHLRVERGKRATATIHLSAKHAGASVEVSISDDGGGINTEAVRQRAVEKGIVQADAKLSETEIFALIFQPGFSTAKQITDVSGRGVGMDVVRQRVESLRGTIEVNSKPGMGTRVTLRLPLTLAIVDGLLVSVADACFVLPLASTLECIELTPADIERANGKHISTVRGEAVPYIRLREHFGVQEARPALEQIMVVETAEGRFGFVVDQVLGDCQSVIKSLGRVYRNVQAVSGATILGDGRVALILDPERLVQDALKAAGPGPRGHPSGAVERARTPRGRLTRTV